MIRSLCKNAFLPEQPSYCGDDVREGGLGLDIPLCTAKLNTMEPRMLGKNKANHAEQPQQARRGTQDRLGHILTRSFKTQMSPPFLKGRFDRPASREPAGDLPEAQADVGGIKVFVPVRALDVVDKDPANRNQSLACLVPAAGISGKFDFALRAAVPTDCSRDQFPAGHQLFRLWQFAALGAGPASAFLGWRRWRGIKIGVSMVAADQCGMTAMTITEHGQFMRSIAAVAQKHEFPLRKPMDHHCHQLAGQVRGRLMSAVFSKVEFFRAIQCAKYRQRPSSRSKREFYRNGQHYPAMAPPIDYVFVSRADRIVMAALAIDMLASVLSRRVIDGDQNRLFSRNKMKNRTSQNLTQRPQGPTRPGKNTMIGTAMAVDCRTHRPQNGGNGSSTYGDNSSDGQRKDSLESRFCKRGRKLNKKFFCCRWNSKHNGLLSELIVVNNNKHRQESVCLDTS